MVPDTERRRLTTDGTSDNILSGVNCLLATRLKFDVAKVSIPQYRDLSGAIDGLYVDEKQINELRPLYRNVLDSRKSLSEIKYFDLTSLESEFVVCLKKYLDDVKIFFRKLFCERTETTSAVLPADILSQIVEGDMRIVSESDAYYRKDARTIRIGVANPLILSSLYITRLQLDDFAGFCSSLGLIPDSPLYTMYLELLNNKTERLFRDNVILYEKGFYRIIAYDCENCQFIARHEDDLSSIEQISAIRLYEKIIKGVSKRDACERFDCLVIGEVKYGSKETLNNMLLASGLDNISVVYIDSKPEVHDVLTHRDKFMDLVGKYKKVFVLDCPEIYSDITLREMSDDLDVIKRSEQSYDSLVSVVDDLTKTRDFYNKNGFSAIYYRVQNYLVRPELRNSSKARYVNRGFLNCINGCFKCDTDGKIERPELRGKEVYVYLSNNRDFRNDMYDSYNFVRVERYNSKDCRIIKFSDRESVPFKSRERVVKTTFYKILKMLSNSEKFLCEMTGDKCRIFDKDSVCEAIRIAQGTKINVRYDPLGNAEPDRIGIDIDVVCPDECKGDATRRDAYKKIVKDILIQAFDPHSDCEDIDNRILFQCFQKAIACVISGCARNFNDLLFHHFYETLYNGTMKKFSFKVSSITFDEAHSDDGENDDETTSYSYKRTAYSLMDDLDSRFYRESDIVSHIHRTTLNHENLNDYAENIKEACVNLNYTQSVLYSRLVRFYS